MLALLRVVFEVHVIVCFAVGLLIIETTKTTTPPGLYVCIMKDMLLIDNYEQIRNV